MLIRTAAAASCLGIILGFSAASPASALSSKECGAKWQAAKASNTTGGVTYNQYRKAQCGADATAEPAAATTAAPAPTAAPANPLKPTPTAAPARAPAAAPAATTNATFPSAVDPKYSKESAGKARMHTCLDQYNANKTSNGDGGLKWIQKGGGYYSECNKRLKGA
jgi:hypothetical protein